MEWLADNWYWVVIVIFVFIFLWRITGRQKKPVTTTRPRPRAVRQSRPQPGRQGLTQQEVDAILVKLTNALERVVDEVVGRHFTRTDRQKIALGMIAVMVAEKIPPDRLINNSKLFVAVMLKSIDTLAKTGQISVR